MPIYVMKEKLWIWFVWLLPKTLVKWCYIRVAAHATTGVWSDSVVPKVTMMQGLQRWDAIKLNAAMPQKTR